MADTDLDCPHCGQLVPAAIFCVRCGEPLRAGRVAHGSSRRSFAAAPGESVARVAVFSTILPQLPDADLDTFRIAFAFGLGTLLLLILVGAFPVALVGAAVLVPAIVLIYVYSIDIYEDTPLLGIGFTMLWGAVWGVVFGIGTSFVVDTGGLGGLRVSDLVALGVLVPLAGLAMMVLGPLCLMRERRFNDVMDGATFGVASAVSFVGAQVIAGSLGLITGGLTPIGEPLPWVATIISIAVALPLVAAGAVGSVVGAFWLRYRAPVRDRAALGLAGRPVVAIVLAGALVVAAALASYLPKPIANVAAELALAAVALVWLRRTLHLGLLEESLEIEVGDDIVCANCGATTRHHTFCGNCGIALRALPKQRRTPPE
jgi:hypothetical protein